MGSAEKAKCFVCHSIISKGTSYAMLSALTTLSQTLLSEKVIEIAQERAVILRNVEEWDIVCRKCFLLLNDIEKLENQTYNVKTQIVDNLLKYAVPSRSSSVDSNIKDVAILKHEAEDDTIERDEDGGEEYQAEESPDNKESSDSDSDAPLIKKKLRISSKRRSKLIERTRSKSRTRRRSKRTAVDSLRCHLCEKGCLSLHGLTRHMKQAHSCMNLQCPQCTELLSTYTDLASHMSNIHGIKNVCRLCADPFGSEIKRKVHELRVHKINHCLKQCDLCGEYFGGKSALTVHIRRHHTGERPFKCTVPNCTFRSTTPNDLKIHTILHTKNFPFQCAICSKGYATQAKLKRHIAIHEREGEHAVSNRTLGAPETEVVYACPQPLCDFESNSKEAMLDHKIMHESTSHKCNVCEYTCDSLEVIKSHFDELHPSQKIFHSNLTTSQNNTVGILTFSLMEDSCQTDNSQGGVCIIQDEQSFYTEKHISTEVKDLNLNEMHQDADGDVQDVVFKNRSCVCQICNKRFTLIGKLLAHETEAHDIHHPRYKCNVCSKEFLQAPALRSHYMRNHSKKYFACYADNCTFRTADAYDFKRHMCIHTGKFPYVCLLCNKGFTNKRKVQLHRLAIHKLKVDNDKQILYNPDILRNPSTTKRPRTLKKFTCDSCGDRMTGFKEYDKHFKNSACIKPPQKCKSYKGGGQCEECGKVFLTSQNLEAHLLDHKGVIKYKCTYADCKKGYNVKSALTAHIKFAHQHIKRLFCELCGEGFRYMASLKSHQATRHGCIVSGKAHHCEQCEKVFPTLSRLTLHISRNHTKQKNFPCREDSCHYTFYSASERKTHEASHNQMLPMHCTYQCNICNRILNSKHKLEEHVFEIHNVKLIEDEVVAEVIIGTDNSQTCIISEAGHTMIVQSEEVLNIS